MSHFSILVISDERPTAQRLESLLLPYHEFECTGIEAYIQDEDITDEVRQEYAESTTEKPFLVWASDYYGTPIVQHNELPHIMSTHKYGFIRLHEDGSLERAIRRTNPNKKWDWYVLGGRFAGQLADKKHGAVDMCRVRDLDHATMAQQRRERRAARWADAEERQLTPKMRHFIYNIALDATRDAYIDTDEGFSTFAVLKAGQWYERGDMGWWGVVSDDKGDGWRGEFADLIGSATPDQWLSIVDCHI